MTDLERAQIIGILVDAAIRLSDAGFPITAADILDNELSRYLLGSTE